MAHFGLLQVKYRQTQEELSKIRLELQSCRSKHLTTSCTDERSFVQQLLKIIGELYDSLAYSDIDVKINDQATVFHAHKFVLEAHGSEWFNDTSVYDGCRSLDLSDFEPDAVRIVLRFVYKNQIEESLSCDMCKKVLELASRFQLRLLENRCAQVMVSFVTVENVFQTYMFATRMSGTKQLVDYCADLIFENWHNFDVDDFSSVPAESMLDLLESRTKYVLQRAIDIHRSDVAYLITLGQKDKVAAVVNAPDENHLTALQSALLSKQWDIAMMLVENGADVNFLSSEGHAEDQCLLHYFIRNRNYTAANFLVGQNCQLNLPGKHSLKSPLHMLAEFLGGDDDHFKQLVVNMIEHGVDASLKDSNGNTALHSSVMHRNRVLFDFLIHSLKTPDLLDAVNEAQETPLWIAITRLEENNHRDFHVHVAHSLVDSGCRILTQPTIIHDCISKDYQWSASFLIKNVDRLAERDKDGLTALHLACSHDYPELVGEMLARDNSTVNAVSDGSPLHWALRREQRQIVDIMIDLLPSDYDYNILDNENETVVSLAMWCHWFDVAEKMIERGADLKLMSIHATPLLHRAIERGDEMAAMFLLNQKEYLEDRSLCSVRSTDNLSPLKHAVQKQLPVLVAHLCELDDNVDTDEDNPLWSALSCGNEDIAALLVSRGFDPDCWNRGQGNYLQTMLHRAIDENHENIAYFLVQSGADVDAYRRPSPDSEQCEEATDMKTPLHLASQWGLMLTVDALVKNGQANVNAKDFEGNTPLHLAISHSHNDIVRLLLWTEGINLQIRNNNDQNCFALALKTRNEKAIRSILEKHPHAAEEFDSHGFNFLHRAVLNSDLESVLFLVSFGASVQSKTKDSHSRAPVHLAAEIGSEIIMRNLLLAGASFNDTTSEFKTSLHIAAENNHSVLCSILLEQKNLDQSAVDMSSSNALHLAVRKGNYDALGTLLTSSSIDPLVFDIRGMNVLHILAENVRGELSLAIFDLLMIHHTTFPLNIPTSQGRTALQLAYAQNNKHMCKALVRAGACLSSQTARNPSIFEITAGDRSLLIDILDAVEAEPPWADHDSCMVCTAKFSMTSRRHHCRHCGRVLCKRCSELEIPIPKFQLEKSVRVCRLCFDLLTMGPANM